MKKILITESQAKLISEEIYKNNLIQKIVFCKPEDITFKMYNGVPTGVPVNRQFNVLVPIIDGVEIPRDLIKLECEEYNVDDELFWQLHIEINNEIRRMGIAEKIYIAFIEKGNKVVSLFNNRAATFYKKHDSVKKSDSAIGGLWNKIKNYPNIQVYDLGDCNGNVIGITAELK